MSKTKKRPLLQSLPRVEDAWTFLYVHRAHIERDMNAVLIVDKGGRLPVPSAALSTLMLGPGSTITHAAVSLLAENSCSVVWTGEDGIRMYAAGLGATRQARNLLHQAEAWGDPETRQDVVLRMYRMRFNEALSPDLTLEQVRGKEGVRVREAYAQASKEFAIPWSGRRYDRGNWAAADPVNRALSAANACLYGVVHAAIVAAGFSPALGFVHTGKMLSFVYDIADLYKCDVTVPVAFQAVSIGTDQVARRVRTMCRAAFYRHKILRRVIPDIQHAVGLKRERVRVFVYGYDDEGVSGLWDPHEGVLEGGQNYSEEPPVQ